MSKSNRFSLRSRRSRSFPVAMDILESRALLSTCTFGINTSSFLGHLPMPVIPPISITPPQEPKIPPIVPLPPILPPISVLPIIFDGATILFSQAPSAVQTGLTNLASSQNLTAPAATDKVLLGNVDGTETFAMSLNDASNTPTRIIVDQNGNQFVPAVQSQTTFGVISNMLVTDEFNTIATDLNLTMPGTSDKVFVSTPSSGPAVYTMFLFKPSPWARFSFLRQVFSVSVNDLGDPVGHQNLPLEVFSMTIQNALIADAPAGSNPLTPNSIIAVRTNFGLTTYTATYTPVGTGPSTRVTVDAGGNTTSLPATSTVAFSTLPQPAQDELQTLANAKGFVGTIDPTTNVSALAENNGTGTVLYTIRVQVPHTTTGGRSYNLPLVLTVDQAGNPTVSNYFFCLTPLALDMV